MAISFGENWMAINNRVLKGIHENKYVNIKEKNEKSYKTTIFRNRSERNQFEPITAHFFIINQ